MSVLYLPLVGFLAGMLIISLGGGGGAVYVGVLTGLCGIALYGDYCYSDYTDVLPTITVPVLVVAADSGIFPKSVEQGKWIAAQIPKGEFVPFYEGGHLLYWLEADKFNQAVTDFADRL